MDSRSRAAFENLWWQLVGCGRVSNAPMHHDERSRVQADVLYCSNELRSIGFCIEWHIGKMPLDGGVREEFISALCV